MESILTTQKSIFINNEAGTSRKSLALKTAAVDAAEQQQQNKKPVIKSASNKAIADAQAIFARANSYADVSAKVQKNLQAYEAVEVSLKREALSQLMGVDLYA